MQITKFQFFEVEDMPNSNDCPSLSEIGLNSVKGAIAGGSAGMASGALLAGTPGAIVLGIDGALGGAVYEGVSSLIDKLECEYGKSQNSQPSLGTSSSY
jgi:hypothetical protein